MSGTVGGGGDGGGGGGRADSRPGNAARSERPTPIPLVIGTPTPHHGTEQAHSLDSLARLPTFASPSVSTAASPAASLAESSPPTPPRMHLTQPAFTTPGRLVFVSTPGYGGMQAYSPASSSATARSLPDANPSTEFGTTNRGGDGDGTGRGVGGGLAAGGLASGFEGRLGGGGGVRLGAGTGAGGGPESGSGAGFGPGPGLGVGMGGARARVAARAAPGPATSAPTGHLSRQPPPHPSSLGSGGLVAAAKGPGTGIAAPYDDDVMSPVLPRLN